MSNKDQKSKMHKLIMEAVDNDPTAFENTLISSIERLEDDLHQAEVDNGVRLLKRNGDLNLIMEKETAFINISLGLPEKTGTKVGEAMSLEPDFFKAYMARCYQTGAGSKTECYRIFRSFFPSGSIVGELVLMELLFTGYAFYQKGMLELLNHQEQMAPLENMQEMLKRLRQALENLNKDQDGDNE